MNKQSSLNVWKQHQSTIQNSSKLETLISASLDISNWITASVLVLTSVIKYEKVSFKNQKLQHKQEIILSQEDSLLFVTFLPELDQFNFVHQTTGRHHEAQPKLLTDRNSCNKTLPTK